MESEIEFGDTTMRTVVYIIMDAQDQLLLSEGVCRQLGIVMYVSPRHTYKYGVDDKPKSHPHKGKILEMSLW